MNGDSYQTDSHPSSENNVNDQQLVIHIFTEEYRSFEGKKLVSPETYNELSSIESVVSTSQLPPGTIITYAESPGRKEPHRLYVNLEEDNTIRYFDMLTFSRRS